MVLFSSRRQINLNMIAKTHEVGLGGRRTWRFSIRVHTRLADDGFDVVTVSNGLAECLEEDGGKSLAPGVSIRSGVPHEGSPIG